MQTRAVLNLCLAGARLPTLRQMPHILGPLNAMLKPPAYEYEVRYPIEFATAQENLILPSREAVHLALRLSPAR
jgi:hypothetical protein